MQDEKSENRALKNGGRFLFFIIVFSLIAAFIFVRYCILMFNPPETEVVNPVRKFPERGPIYDRNGRILALQTKLGNVNVWRPDIDDLDALCRALSPVLEMSVQSLKNRIESSNSDFVYLKKQVDESTMRAVEDARLSGYLRGVGIEPILGRIYPEKQLASQIIGFVGDENNGLGGIEYAFNSELAAKDNAGSGNGSSTDITNGNQVYLTIDINVQFILEDIAARILAENEAESVMLMAMDPRSGDILGAASLPNFDPNNLGNSNTISRMDRPAIWAYEPGSVFKVFSIASLLDSGAIAENTSFICNGFYDRTTNLGEHIRISDLLPHGHVTAREIIIQSCNVGAAYAADRIAANPFYDRLRNFGFGSRTGAGDPGETAGFIRPIERWSDRSKPTIAMGQEIAVSALQMIQAATAIANDGILVPPRVVSKIVSADGTNQRIYESGPPRRIIKAETARALRSYMVDVTTEPTGTGLRARMPDLKIAVKTGTAQIIDTATGAYSETDFLASCIALLPADNPSLILYLVISRPQGPSYLGGRIAAPAIRQTAETLVEYLGIPRGLNPQVVHSGSIALLTRETPEITDTVPDFFGYSKRELLELLLRDDLHIEMNGDGWVRRQTPPPGTPLENEMAIILELE
ncbi:penicillin-binding protein [Spirochaetia bacterium]|nr:penicillin-binding protein [Spirochaetia bacterium]